MNKTQFINALRRGLSQLPPEEIEKQVSYYSEIIDDMLEDGMSEYEATAKLGSVEEIYQNILRDMPLPLLVKSRAKPSGGWTALQIVLIILGFPVWFSLLAVLLAIVLTVYICIWALAIAAFAVVVSIAAVAIFCIIMFIRLIFTSGAAALLILGCGFVLAGFTVLAGIAAVWLCKLIVKATAAVGRWIKSLFIRKES